MDKRKLILSLQDIVENTKHPQIKKSEAKIVNDKDKEYLGFYLFNPIKDNSLDDFYPVFCTVTNTGELDIKKKLVMEIIELDFDKKFLSRNDNNQDIINADFNAVLLDFPNSFGSLARFTRSHEDGRIVIQMYCHLNSEEKVHEEEFYFCLSHSLILLNYLHLIIQRNRLSQLTDILSKDQIQEKINYLQEKVKSWTFFKDNDPIINNKI